MASTCPQCGCTAATDAHRLLALLAADAIDAALDAGLLEAVACPTCSTACNSDLLAARDTRQSALVARARHVARTQRLARIARERAATRAPATPATPGPAAVASTATPALPSAASAALARALAKARNRHA